MKIELKLTADEINYIERKTIMIQSINAKFLQKEKLTAYSIMLDISDKIMAKAKILNRKTDLFDVKKKHKLSLKYHEADTLEEYLMAYKEEENDAYKKNLALKIVTQLNQKLA